MSCRNEPRAGSLDGTAGTAYRASTERGREFGQRDSSPRGRKSSTCPSGKSPLRNDSDFWNAVAVTTQTLPRHYPGSCSQREPKKGQTLLREKPLIDDALFCGSLGWVQIQEGLITQRWLVQIQPPQQPKSTDWPNLGAPSAGGTERVESTAAVQLLRRRAAR